MTDPFKPQILPPQDYFNPFIEVFIVSGEDSAIKWTPLWFGGTTEKPTSMAINAYSGSTVEARKIEALSYVTSASFEIGEGIVTKLSITLDPPIEAARALIESDLIAYGSSSLAMRIGYTVGVGSSAQQSSSPQFSALCTEPDVSYGTSTSITLNAQGTGGFTAAMRIQTGASHRHNRLEILRGYLSELNITWNAQSEAFVLDAINDGKFGMKPAFETEEAVVTSERPMLYLLQDLVARCNCLMVLQDTEAVIYPAQAVLGSANKPVLNLRFFDYPSGNLGIRTKDFPILSASTSSKQMFLSPRARTLLQQNRDPVTGRELPKETKPEEREGSGTAGPVDVTSAPSTAPVAADTQGQTNHPALESMRAALLGLKSDEVTGVVLEVETIGIPELLPLMNVSVFGLGKALDRVYTVTTVKHSYSSSGFTTSLTLRQTELPPVAAEVAVPGTGPAVAQPPTSTDSTPVANTGGNTTSSTTAATGDGTATSGVSTTTRTVSTVGSDIPDVNSNYFAGTSAASLTPWEQTQGLRADVLAQRLGALNTEQGRAARRQFMADIGSTDSATRARANALYNDAIAPAVAARAAREGRLEITYVNGQYKGVKVVGRDPTLDWGPSGRPPAEKERKGAAEGRRKDDTSGKKKGEERKSDGKGGKREEQARAKDSRSAQRAAAQPATPSARAKR